MRVLIVACILLVGCDPNFIPMSNEDISKAVKECKDAGLSTQTFHDEYGRTVRVECIDPNGKEIR